MTKSTRFKEMLQSPDLEFILEAHNGISAKIVEEAGFKGIWGSGLALSAQYGVRDNNEASWTQILEMVEFMSDATSIPIMLDGDTGYGNFNNMRRLVRKLEQRGVAAVCIEDKLFPKTNSYIRGVAQPLADVDEFCGKIKAGKDAQRDPDFCVVARVEAFVAGWGLKEALKRSEAYHDAGADAVLIHSALSVPDEIFAFMREWGDRLPVVIVPTSYYATPTELFREHGVALVIWANQMLRAAVAAMKKTAEVIHRDERLHATEDSLVPVKELFRLQGAGELEIAERLYLPCSRKSVRAVVLAASRGKELGALTEFKPKGMVALCGHPILAHIVECYNSLGVKDVLVVRGYHKERVNLSNVTYADNDDYATTGEVASLAAGLAALDPAEDAEKDLVVSYGDVLFRKYLLQLLLDSEAGFTVVVDVNWQESVNADRFADLVTCSEPCSRRLFGGQVELREMSSDLPAERVHGEWNSLFKASGERISVLRETVAELMAQPKHRAAKMSHLLNALVARGETVSVIYTTGHWLDIDSVEDLIRAGQFT